MKTPTQKIKEKMGILPIFALLIPTLATAAIPLKNQPGSGQVKFLAVGRPSALKVHGTATGPAGNLQLDGTQLKGAVTFALEKLDTGIALRNEHMKEKYLQVKEHPEAKLTLLDAPVEADFAKSLSTSEKKFRGKLFLHGKEKEVSGTFEAKNGLVKAKFPITLSDFAIDVPKYLGITIANTVDLDVELPLQK